MNTAKKPVRTTISFGLVCAVIFLFFGKLFEFSIFWSIYFKVAIFSCLTFYSFLLATWADKRRMSVAFPLLFLMIFIFSGSSISGFLLLCMGILSWIRSGICYENTFSRSLGAEIIFTIGGSSLVAYFNPQSTMAWALGIWMFFLIQSLYFITAAESESEDLTIDIDEFETARIRAENILNA